MGHDKLDKKVKQTLSERVILPQPASWNRLEQMLDEQEKEHKKPWFYYAIAASVIVLFGLLFLMNNTTDSTASDKEIFVNEEVKEEPNTDAPIIIENKSKAITSTNLNDEEKQDSNTTKVVQVKRDRVASAVVKQSINKKPVQEKTFKALEVSTNDIAENRKEIKNKIDHKEIQDQEKLKTLDKEVTTLLAENSPKEETINNNKEQQEKTATVTFKVDPDELLREVEADAEQSFRAKIFQKLKNGFKKTSTVTITQND